MCGFKNFLSFDKHVQLLYVIEGTWYTWKISPLVLFKGYIFLKKIDIFIQESLINWYIYY